MAAYDNQGISDFQALTNSVATLGAAILPSVLNKRNSDDQKKPKPPKPPVANNNKNKVFGVGNETWFMVGAVGAVILIVVFLTKKK
jgi:hypothetical protein